MEANTGASALSAFAEHKPDLVVLDILLPGVSGAEVCLSLRRQSSVPIIMLTSRTEEMDRVVGLEIGADDYVTKSLSTREMVARVKDHIRRSNKLSMPAGNRRLVCDDMVLDLDQHMFTVAGTGVDLSRREFQLLTVFLIRRGTALSRRELLQLAWGDGAFVVRTVDVHVRWLRAKIEKDPACPQYIQTVRGVGHRFRP